MNQFASVISRLDGVYMVDSQEVGIYQKPTMYVWVHVGMKNKVVSDINQLYPNVFQLFEPRFKMSKNDKLVLKINQTEIPMPISSADPLPLIERIKNLKNLSLLSFFISFITK